MNTHTRRDPESFAWGDLCDVYGTPYHIGDQLTIDVPPGFPNFDAELGPTTILWLEAPPDDETETDYVTGRPNDPAEIGGWTHYKLRELTIHKGTRVPPAEVIRMIAAAQDEGDDGEWIAKARARVVELTGPDGNWID